MNTVNKAVNKAVGIANTHTVKSVCVVNKAVGTVKMKTVNKAVNIARMERTVYNYHQQHLYQQQQQQ